MSVPLGLRSVQVFSQWSRLVIMFIYAIVSFVLLDTAGSPSWGHLCPIYVHDADGTESEFVVSACDWIDYMDFHTCPFERIADQCDSVNAACNCDESIKRLIDEQTNSSATASVKLQTRNNVPKCAATKNTDFLVAASKTTALILFALHATILILDSQLLGSIGDGNNSVTINRGPAVAKLVSVLVLLCIQLLIVLFRVASSGAFPGLSPPGATINGLRVMGANEFHMDILMHSFVVCVPASGDCGASGALGTTPHTWKRILDIDFLGSSVYAIVCLIELLLFFLLLVEVITTCIQYIIFEPNMAVAAKSMGDKLRNLVFGDPTTTPSATQVSTKTPPSTQVTSKQSMQALPSITKTVEKGSDKSKMV